MADSVTGDQTDNVVGRTSACYATPTTNCCGCPEDVLVVLRFSCPCLSHLVALCFLVLLFCFASHISGGARHFLVNSIHISLHIFSYFSVVSCLFRFPLCQRIWIACICIPYLSTQYDSTSLRCLLCLLR